MTTSKVQEQLTLFKKNNHHTLNKIFHHHDVYNSYFKLSEEDLKFLYQNRIEYLKKYYLSLPENPLLNNFSLVDNQPCYYFQVINLNSKNFIFTIDKLYYNNKDNYTIFCHVHDYYEESSLEIYLDIDNHKYYCLSKDLFDEIHEYIKESNSIG